MKFHVQSSLFYQVSGPSTLLCSLSCSETGGQKIIEESLHTSRPAHCEEIAVGLTHNRFNSIEVEGAGDFTVGYEAKVTTGVQLVDDKGIAGDPVGRLDAHTLPFLFPSRYAPSDLMREQANDLFAGISGKYQQAVAIEEWLSSHVDYVVGASDEGSSALDTFESKSGVCRDFAHLGIAFCRALTIPARYVTVYAYQLEPQDFHAVFEVYIGGAWYVIDGTRKAPLNGMIRIGTGRDAGDAAVATLFGAIQGAGIAVDTRVAEEETENFEAMTREALLDQGQALLLG